MVLGLAFPGHAAPATARDRRAPAAETRAAVDAAIVSAVLAQLGDAARVRLEELEVRGDLAGAAAIVAVLDPATRLGARVRVPLRSAQGRGRRVRVGEAICVIRAEAPLLEVVAPVARGAAVDASAVRSRVGSLDGLPLLAPVARVGDATARRDLSPGDILLPHDIAVAPAVRTGDPVRLRVRHGTILASVDGIARQDGAIGEEIRILNPSSGRMLRGRVVGPREVEVAHGS
jgi:flagella basal body P-ring formation protein FlgA